MARCSELNGNCYQQLSPSQPPAETSGLVRDGCLSHLLAIVSHTLMERNDMLEKGQRPGWPPISPVVLEFTLGSSCARGLHAGLLASFLSLGV